jgi:sugar porter (SP) family MFS transporter
MYVCLREWKSTDAYGRGTTGLGPSRPFRSGDDACDGREPLRSNSIFVFRCSLIAALGGLLFGFDTAVISGTTEALQNLYGLSDGWLGFTVASALIGTIVGSIAVGWPTDRIGRRNILIWIGALYFVSALGSALAWDWYSFLMFRFIGGLGVGGASVASPMYIAEISPARSRGRLVALAQFNIVLGILLAFVSNYVITLLPLGDVEWRWMYGVEALPAAVFFLLLFFNPRSPRWLMSKGRQDEARAVLSRVQGDTKAVAAELQAIQESLDLEHHSMRERFYSLKYIKPILLACAIAVFNQLSGINALLYYAPKIFKMTGAGGESAMFQSVLIGLVNLVFTMAALAVIDRLGRKKLMLAGSIGYIVSLAVVAGTFYFFSEEFAQANAAMEAVEEARESGALEAVIADLEAREAKALAAVKTGGAVILVSFMVFIASHAFGQGAVIWVFISEIFPNRVRARGQALASFSLWVANAAIAQVFPILLGGLGGGPCFAMFTAFMVLQLFWVIVYMPETKGIPLEEIQKRLHID